MHGISLQMIVVLVALSMDDRIIANVFAIFEIIKSMNLLGVGHASKLLSSC